MKFIKLESRGGNYLVVAENIAWLRTAENGQTSVGMMGGQPLLVVGSIEEVAEKILSATREQQQPEAAVPTVAVVTPTASAHPAVQVPAAATPTSPPETTEQDAHPANVVDDVAPESDPHEEIVATPADEAASEPDPASSEPALSEPAPSLVANNATSAPAPAITRMTGRNAVPLWERSVPRAAATSTSLRVKAGSQRFMGKHD